MYRQVKRAISLLLVIVLLFSLSCEVFAQTLVLPASLRAIEEEAFYGDESLNEVVIPDGTETIGPRAFADSATGRVFIPDSVTDIADDAFAGAENTVIVSSIIAPARDYALNHDIPWMDTCHEEIENIDDIDVLFSEEYIFTPFDTERIDLSDLLELGDEFVDLVAEFDAIQDEYLSYEQEYTETLNELKSSYTTLCDLYTSSFEITDAGDSFVLDTGSYQVNVDYSVLNNASGSFEFVTAEEQGDDVMVTLRDDAGQNVYVSLQGAQLSISSQTPVRANARRLRSNSNYIDPVPDDKLNNTLDTSAIVVSSTNTVWNMCDKLETELLEKIFPKQREMLNELQATLNKITNARMNERHNKRLVKLIAAEQRTEKLVNAQSAKISKMENAWVAIDYTRRILGASSDLWSIYRASERNNLLRKIRKHEHPGDHEQYPESLLVIDELDECIREAHKRNWITIGFNLTGLVLTCCTFGLYGVAKVSAISAKLHISLNHTGTVMKGLGKALNASPQFCENVFSAVAVFDAIFFSGEELTEAAVQLDGMLHYEIRGAITEAVTRKPLEDVVILCRAEGHDPYSAMSDIEGFFDLEPLGSKVTLLLRKEGYKDQEVQVPKGGGELATDSPENVPIAMEPDRLLTGTVTDSTTGEALAGAEVFLEAEGGTDFLYTSTDSAGVYAFINPPAGRYSVSFEKAGYTAPEPVDITVHEDIRRVYDSQLYPDTETPAAPGGGPDFWQWCVDNLDTEKTFVPALGRSIKDGVLDQSEILGTNIIVLPSAGFTSLAGIERFQNLEYLDCKNNQLTSLNVSGLTKLNHLDCYNNQLTSLNISGCTSLRDLDCHNNQLTSLSFDGCVSLDNVDCRNNRLTELDHSGAPALTGLICQSNQLETLSLRGKSGLTLLECQDNRLTSIDVSGCLALSQFWYERNPQLRSLDISGCKSLEKFDYKNGALTTLNASGCTGMTGLFVENNELTSLNVSGCSALEEIYCYDNLLTSFDVTGCQNLQGLYCDHNELTGALDLSDHTALRRVNCFNNELTSLDASGCTALNELRCETNALEELTLTDCNRLLTLVCGSNRLKDLNLSHLTSLDNPSCVDNQLESLDCSGCVQLHGLDVFNGNPNLRAINFSGCTALENVNISESVRELNLHNCTALTELDFDNYQLESLDVSGCSLLKRLRCTSNALTELDLSGCERLSELYCRDNHLKELDVSDCAALEVLGCADNAITALDVTSCDPLETLYCGNNRLTNLNIQGCAFLTEVNCVNNLFVSLNINGCTALSKENIYADPGVNIYGDTFIGPAA